MRKKFQLFKGVAFTASLLLLLAACNKRDLFFNPKALGNTEKKTIAELVKQSPEHSFLFAAVEKAGLAGTLSGAGTFTVFAPTNDAFRAAGFPTVQSVRNAPADVLKGILLYHVLGSVVFAKDVQGLNATPVTTLAQKDFYVTGKGGKVWVNNARVTTADIKAKNGVIHVIDKVLLPPSQNLVQLAQSNANLSTLVAAVLQLGEPTISTLASGGPFTVMAPTNEAFGKLLVALNKTSLPEIDNGLLATVLTYHLIPGRVFSYNLSEGLEATTAQGSKLTFSLMGGPKVKGNGNASASNILAVDILGTNGVVHVIDQVLLP